MKCSKCSKQAAYKLVVWVEMGWDEGPMIEHLCQGHAKEYALMHMDYLLKDEKGDTSAEVLTELEDGLERFLGAVPYSEMVPEAGPDPVWAF